MYWQRAGGGPRPSGPEPPLAPAEPGPPGTGADLAPGTTDAGAEGTPPAVVEVAIAREVQVDAVAPVVQRAERPARRDHTLPFANGPPIVA